MCSFNCVRGKRICRSVIIGTKDKAIDLIFLPSIHPRRAALSFFLAFLRRRKTESGRGLRIFYVRMMTVITAIKSTAEAAQADL